MAPVRILVVDDFRSWRQFVSTLLQAHAEYQVVGEASDGLEAVRKSEELQPDLILLDIGLPELNGLEAARLICTTSPGSTILFVSENQSLAVVQQALRSSVCTRGYVVKTDAADELLPALEAVTHDRRFVSSRFPASALGDPTDG